MNNIKIFILCHLAFVSLVVDIFHCNAETNVLNLQWQQHGNLHSASTHKSTTTRSTKTAQVLELKQKPHSSLPHTLFASDEARVSSLQQRINRRRDKSSSQLPLVSGIKLQSLNYVVQIAVGSNNNSNTTVIVDTGSDLTWIQCKPCYHCYNQQDPIFDPQFSPSYRSIPCNSTACNSLQQATGNPSQCSSDKSTCLYAVSYGDGSYTRGVLALEKIGLGDTNVDDFVFGCGESNRGLFGGVAGLMGLGRTKLSLISQTSAQFGGIFSYCLPENKQGSSGSLVLGEDQTMYKNSSPISYTRMISDPLKQPFYFLNLTGMRVGGAPVAAKGFSKGRMLIDSGTVISRLVPSVYKALRDEFARQLAEYPAAPSFSILDCCFDLSGFEEVRVPTLRFGFEGGVEMNVDVGGMFYFAKRDGSQVCLAVASVDSEDDVGIIGNFQQKNQRVVYDTMSSRIGFGQEICS